MEIIFEKIDYLQNTFDRKLFEEIMDLINSHQNPNERLKLSKHLIKTVFGNNQLSTADNIWTCVHPQMLILSRILKKEFPETFNNKIEFFKIGNPGYKYPFLSPEFKSKILNSFYTDPKVMNICNWINQYPDICTYRSCQGHEESIDSNGRGYITVYLSQRAQERFLQIIELDHRRHLIVNNRYTDFHMSLRLDGWLNFSFEYIDKDNSENKIKEIIEKIVT